MYIISYIPFVTSIATYPKSCPNFFFPQWRDKQIADFNWVVSVQAHYYNVSKANQILSTNNFLGTL